MHASEDDMRYLAKCSDEYAATCRSLTEIADEEATTKQTPVVVTVIVWLLMGMSFTAVWLAVLIAWEVVRWISR